jgi:hypothetical protein
VDSFLWINGCFLWKTGRFWGEGTSDQWLLSKNSTFFENVCSVRENKGFFAILLFTQVFQGVVFAIRLLFTSFTALSALCTTTTTTILTIKKTCLLITQRNKKRCPFSTWTLLRNESRKRVSLDSGKPWPHSRPKGYTVGEEPPEERGC